MKRLLQLTAGGVGIAAVIIGLTFAISGFDLGGSASPREPQVFTAPLQIELVAAPDASWNMRATLAKWSKELASRGFEQAGDYTFKPNTGPRLRTFLHPQSAVVAVISESEDRIVVEVCTEYADGSSLSYVSEFFGTFDHPPNSMVKHFDEGPTQLYERMLRDRPSGELRRIAADEIPGEVERDWARSIEHLLQKGGYSTEEFRAIGKNLNVELSDAEIAELQQIWRKQAAAKVHEFIVDRLIAEPPESVALDQSHRTRLVTINQLRDRERLAALAKEKLPAAPEAFWKTANAPSSRAMFQAFVESLPESDRPRLIATVDSPLPTNVYLLPEPSAGEEPQYEGPAAGRSSE